LPRTSNDAREVARVNGNEHRIEDVRSAIDHRDLQLLALAVAHSLGLVNCDTEGWRRNRYRPLTIAEMVIFLSPSDAELDE